MTEGAIIRRALARVCNVAMMLNLGRIEIIVPDDHGACSPPSGLPAISPSRGEISFRNGHRKSPVPEINDGIRDRVISPLEGEMAGRPEGGVRRLGIVQSP
jgi:hypothetical protein